MMGPIPGNPVDAGQFAPFQPAKVLYELDGPRTFVFVPADGELYLAHWFDESPSLVRYLVVPFSPALVSRLETGQLSLRDALDQPRLWVVDVNEQAVPIAAARTTLEDLPADELPVTGTLLSAALESIVLNGSPAGDKPAAVSPVSSGLRTA